MTKFKLTNEMTQFTESISKTFWNLIFVIPHLICSLCFDICHFPSAYFNLSNK